MLLDGAQGVGAVPVDVSALGCDAYAGAGQKWLCGPDGTGMLYVSARLRERLVGVAPRLRATCRRRARASTPSSTPTRAASTRRR